MEWAWILAGMAAGGVIGVLGTRFALGTPRKPAGASLNEDERERRYKLLAADVDAALDKMEHLYDRIRKRAPALNPAGNGETEKPRFLDGPSVVRYAREKGLIK